MTPAITILAANELVEPVAAGWQLILAALAGIALIVVLITVAKLHPFLALIFGAVAVGIVAGENRGMSSTRSARDSATPPPRWAS
jgi:GntP family gluconate:H+ symporter